jgi:dipeptidyl aminopeptidase/acylaminoacyl peptidase
MRFLALILFASALGGEEPSLARWQSTYEAWSRGMDNVRLGGARWSADGERLAFDWRGTDGKVLRRELLVAKGKIREGGEPAGDPKQAPILPLVAGRAESHSSKGWVSPDRRWRARVEGAALHLEPLGEHGPSILLSPAAPAGSSWEGEPRWSPDGRRFAIWSRKAVTTREMVLKNSTDGKSRTLGYPVAGDPLPERTPWVFDIHAKTGSPLPPELIGPTYDFNGLEWTANSRGLRASFIRRGFTGHGLVEHRVAERDWRILLEERDPKFVYTFGQRFRHDLADGTTLWTSERSDWNHLYRIDLRNGRTLHAITRGEWVMRRVLHVDEKAGWALLECLGLGSGENPYHSHLCRVGLDGTGFVDLTPEDAHHELRSVSPCGRHLLVTSSRPDLPPRHSVRRIADGSVVAQLGQADVRRAKDAGWTPQRAFVAKDREGKFDIWGLVTRPHPFDPAKRYPVIEHIYAGPQDSFVPRGFNPWVRNHRELSLAGFYVVQIDGRGTWNRGKAFHQEAWRNLADSGFPDRIAWMRELAKTEPQMDLSRVGIFGGSAGGQSTAWGLLRHGDFYRAGVADCGCYDNRVDKLWWNEQWLGWPVGPWYTSNSCSSAAANLRGHLLLTVGEVDSNVDPQSTLQFHQALRNAGKGGQVALRVIPGGGHGAGEANPERLERVRFLRQHLGGPR